MPASPWAADIHVTTTLAVRCLMDAFPSAFCGLTAERVQPFGEGWDNAAFLVDGRWVFRFPRRSIAVPWLRNELRWLPAIADRFPGCVPHPHFVGKPTSAFPYPFYGYALLFGTTACQANLPLGARHTLADGLAAFLAALHAAPVPDSADLPRDLIGRAHAPRLIARIQQATTSGRFDQTPISLPAVRGVCAAAAPLADSTVLCWVHGDLYARHVLVDDVTPHSARLTGIIDWGDLHVGDPALDLSAAYSMFFGADREHFFARYGPVDSTMHARARLRALHYGVVLLEYGTAVDDVHLLRVAHEALACATHFP